MIPYNISELINGGNMSSKVEQLDGHTADLYVAMIKAVSKIEAGGKLSLDDVENMSLRVWVWLQEEEVKHEEKKGGDE